MRVVYKVKIFKIFVIFLFLHCYQDCLKMKKSWKRVSGCNLVAVKTIWKFSRTLGLPYPSLLDVKSFHPTPHAFYIWVDYCGTYNGSKSNGIRHVYFFFMLKYWCNPLLYAPSTCSALICFKVQMTLDVQLGLDTQWKVYSNLTRIWIILINLCHFK